ncbi:hypothetical protein [Desulfobacula sp.]|uniref:hypothetical protein n=1 Tax=Desulfobacula sp. TaxID=2593537 RepID=UPI002622497E|nr:hypothetical protein [Desulfobacula sp.]
MIFTTDKHLNFIIDNIDDIEALNEIYKRAQIKIPEIVNNLVTKSILELQHPFQKDHNLVIETDGDCVYWYDDRSYDIDKDVGLYFQYDFIDWEDLTDKSVDVYPAFNLYLEPKGKNRKEKMADFQKCMGIFKKEEEYKDEITVLNYSLRHIINIGKLKNSEDFKANIQKTCINFTDDILPRYKKYFQKEGFVN